MCIETIQFNSQFRKTPFFLIIKFKHRTVKEGEYALSDSSLSEIKHIITYNTPRSWVKSTGEGSDLVIDLDVSHGCFSTQKNQYNLLFIFICFYFL